MELVYLWVEEYKNIRNQGFNFSPRFDGKNLTITKNKDYISIFPNNINIMAIVGEKLSGESSVLAILTEIFCEDDFKQYFKISEKVFEKVEREISINY